MANLIKQILQYNAGRESERLALKYAAMRSDAFVFLRATCHLFYGQLPQAKVLVEAPAAWACGDLHLENFGSYKGDNRLVYFDLNDFDEAALAPASWDPLRFVTSVLVGRAALQATPQEALALGARYLDAYALALAQGKARWVEREAESAAEHSPVAELLESLQSRHRPAFLDHRTRLVGKRRRIRLDNGKALPASADQRAQVEAFFNGFAPTQAHAAFFKVLDVARRVAGTGSLGLERFIVLVQGKGSPDANYLLDLKQALPSSLAKPLRKTTEIKQPKWADQAQRVVGVQRSMQAVSMAFLHAVQLSGQAYMLRGLQPSEDRVNLASVAGHPQRLDRLMAVMGQCTAWAQLRSSGRGGATNADALMAFGAQTKWRKALLEVAQTCAERTQADWKTYASAYDDGVFKR